MAETNTALSAGRIARQFDTLRAHGKKALVTFVTAGDPGAGFHRASHAQLSVRRGGPVGVGYSLL